MSRDRLTEPYVTDDSPLDEDPAVNRCGPRKFGPITVAPGNMWVMGDHRLVSQDSCCQGQVPIKNIIGRAFVIVWPRDHWATLSSHHCLVIGRTQFRTPFLCQNGIPLPVGWQKKCEAVLWVVIAQWQAGRVFWPGRTTK